MLKLFLGFVYLGVNVVLGRFFYCCVVKGRVERVLGTVGFMISIVYSFRYLFVYVIGYLFYLFGVYLSLLYLIFLLFFLGI